MRNGAAGLLFSATDLINHLGCSHSAFLDLRQLVEPVEIAPPDEQTVLLQQKGIAHERAYLAGLKARGLAVVELVDGSLTLPERVALTREAMANRADVIYQGALLAAPWHGYSDFLLRVDTPSDLGGWSYEVADTKLSRSVKPKHVLQLCVYSALVGREQGRVPRAMHVVLGDGSTVSLKVDDFMHYFAIARARFEAYAARPPAASAGEPCGHCTFCRWAERCEAEWDAADHLSLVANISRSQTKKLREAGIATARDLAALPPGTRIPRLQAETLDRLLGQAMLQVAKRADGENRCERLPLAPGRGFARLPHPADGDLFFDMEGDPLFDGGLEYLFGFAHRNGGEIRFTPFWAHSRAEEKVAFERAVDFIVARLNVHPDAHVYHYAAYEETALKRLAMLHGTREAEIDDLLRRGKLVDLYKVVREAVRVSEPRYSIKNLEVFYMKKRAGEVKTAGESIVVYERWRELQDPALLQEIADYNEADCRSTLLCRDWLLTLRPADSPWFVATAVEAPDPAKEEKRREAEARTASYITRLLDGVPAETIPYRELVGHLLEFHRREAKPQYWAMFHRQELSEEELVDDAECIGGLRQDPSTPPFAVKRSTVHTFTFPPQDFKMRVGDKPLRAATLEPAGEIVALDEDARTVALKIGPTAAPFEEVFSIIPGRPVGYEVLRDAVYRYADSVLAGDGRYAAVTSALGKEAPRVAGLPLGAAILPAGADALGGAVSAICGLADSHMLVQGPPGAGKTFTSSHAIVELLARGRRIGVASNSHKAINNLLQAVERVAAERRVRFRGVKKSSAADQFLNGGGMIEDTTDNDVAANGGHALVAGTAWLFARPDLDQALDHLFIDEAGQVSLANVVAMGVSARNIVLVGDQMQLSQPIQGVHPGSSGRSTLEHLLGDLATVPPDRGIFLAVTRRMHPDVCRFISEAVYDGRLRPDDANASQALMLGTRADEVLAPSGLRFVAVEHEGCAQKSEAEAERLRRAYESLLGQRWTDRRGVVREIGVDDILVVSPYNMQVNLLKSALPSGARVGTVDKFQGQEAAVVLISMATSSGEDLPRNIEFLYSRNRLNVAISRARCLAVIFASPRLLEIACSTVEQIRLVNTLCWAKVYADGPLRGAASPNLSNLAGVA